MICNRFDVVKVPFPFTDKDASKTRPALVISNREFNQSVGRTVFAMVTSSTRITWLHDTKITNLNEAGLSVPCCVRMKLFTIDNAFVIQRFGCLSSGDSALFEKNFNKMMIK